MLQKDVYHLEEIGQQYREIVGNKSANLGEMSRVEGISVPPGFAISIGAYEKFAKETGISQEIMTYTRHTFPEGLGFTDLERLQKASLEIRRIVESREIPEYLKEDIATHYRVMCDGCGMERVVVSVRSAGAKSHPGQYETYLNVVGFDHILQRIVRVWSSIYNTKSISAALRQAMPIEACPPVGVCVLKMVNARAAGVCLTVHPITGNDSEAFVESSLGLGESVVSGAVVPDKFVVDKQSLTLKEIVPGRKEKQIVATNQGVIEEVVPVDAQTRLSVTEEEVVGIVKLANKLESYFGVPQDIEWAVDRDLPPPDNIIILQTRAQVGIPEKKTAVDKIADMMIRKYRDMR